MTNRAASPGTASRSAAGAILTAGFVAGALDLAYVVAFYAFRGVPAQRVVQGIAAGAIGRDAAGRGGMTTVALGMALHFVIALGAAAVFYAASRKIGVLVKRPVVSGLGYGLLVWLVMNLVVLPLSAAPGKFPSPVWPAILVAHLLCVGLPIALVVRRCAPR